MLLQYRHQDCINLILEELKKNPYFLEFSELELIQYFYKIDNNCYWTKHYENGKLTGFVAFYCNNLESKQAFITLVLVDSKFRGLNIAIQMLNKVLVCVQFKGFTSCALEVKLDNLNAIKVYQSLGFEKIHVMKKENSLKMCKSL